MDEDGNQLAVFNRRGSRPFNREEAERLYMKNGQLFTVTNRPGHGEVDRGARPTPHGRG